jgi:hypothetical protein
MTCKSTRLRNCAYWLEDCGLFKWTYTPTDCSRCETPCTVSTCREGRLRGVAIGPLGPFGKRSDFDPFRSRPIDKYFACKCQVESVVLLFLFV